MNVNFTFLKIVYLTLYLPFITSTATENPRIFPQRTSDEAAVVEWGNSAIISALDAAVASFGPQTSRGAFFEVETAPIIAQPIDGSLDPGETKLKNSDDVEGNMLVMTNSSPNNLTPVQLATIAQNNGAAALMIVNVADGSGSEQLYDYIYSAGVEEGEEDDAEKIDIPVIMTSLSSGNLLTSAGSEGEEDELSMPERVRLYAAGDRPFFEDVSSSDPVVYLIHNLLSEEECDMLVKQAQGKTDPVEKGDSNILEGYDVINHKVQGLERVYLWQGSVTKGATGKAIDERIEQVTGFPKDHISDFQIDRYSKAGSGQDAHYDTYEETTPDLMPMASITVFLNDYDPETDKGGEVVFPSANVKIFPKKGMAVVHHTVVLKEDDINEVDIAAVYADSKYTSKKHDKWIAKRFVYSSPISPSRRIVLPLLAVPFGGKMPKIFCNIHDFLVDKFGLQSGSRYFDKILMSVPIFVAFMLVSLISSTLQSDKEKNNSTKKKSIVATAKVVRNGKKNNNDSKGKKVQ